MLDKLQRSLAAGQHYEAQQMLKTVYYRFRARKQLHEAYQLLQVLLLRSTVMLTVDSIMQPRHFNMLQSARSLCGECYSHVDCLSRRA